MSQPRFASSLSRLTDAEGAVAAIASEVRTALGELRPDLVACFVSHHHGPAIEELGPRLARELHAKVLIGCTGESIIGSAHEIERGPALSVLAAVMPGTTVQPFAVHSEGGDEGETTFSSMPHVRIASEASLILLADPFSFPVHDFLERLNVELPGVPAIGGLASGGQGPGQNLLFTHAGLVEGGAIGVVVEGDVEVRAIVSQGCRPIGKPFVVTGCKDNFVLKLSGKPAYQVLMETLQSLPTPDQKLMQRGPFLGLALDPTKSSFERGDFLARGIVGLDKEANAIAVADEGLRNGMTVQFLVRDAASAGEDLEHLVRDRAGKVDPASTGALVFSCNGRGSRMFQRPDHDIGCIRAGLETEVPAAGFFALGEIGPVGGKNFLHGFTASVALLRQRSAPA
jgi:small ligand-binding sensory domain FIST